MKRETASGTALRRFRPPQPVRVEVKQGQPVRVFDFQNAAGMRASGRLDPHNVIWAAGPWQESGEWWSKQPWSREVWDIALREDGHVILLRTFRDVQKDKWFVEAVYD